MVKSFDAFLLIFLAPFNSLAIDTSSPWVKNLNVTSFLDKGKVNENSFLPSTTKDSSNGLSSMLFKSIDISSPLYVKAYSLP